MKRFDNGDVPQAKATVRAPRAAAQTRQRWVAHLLLDDSEIAAAIPVADHAQARRELVVAAVSLPCGPWSPPEDFGGGLAMLIADGLAVRGTGGRRARLRLLEQGDVVDAYIAGEDKWLFLRPTVVAALDASLVTAASRWPQLWTSLVHRVFATSRRRAELDAILAVPHAEARVLALLEYLAARCGRETDEGTIVDLPLLTHGLIGEIVAARRPTVSLAMAGLAQRCALVEHGRGRWVLPRSPATRATRPQAEV